MISILEGFCFRGGWLWSLMVGFDFVVLDLFVVAFVEA